MTDTQMGEIVGRIAGTLLIVVVTVFVFLKFSKKK